MQTLEVFQSLWAMTHSADGASRWSLPLQIKMIHEAGFKGVDIVIGDVDEETIEGLLDQYNLACTVTAFPDCTAAIEPAVALAKKLSARHLNIIGKVYPFSIDEGVRQAREWLAECDDDDVKVTIETHRDCLTTDLHYTLQLIEAAPEIQLSADLSHYVVGREIGWPITPEVNAQMQRVLDRSSAFQGRIASREQIQVALDFPQHQKWLAEFQRWWLHGFRGWRARAGNNDCLNFLCELGPPEYAITDAEGKELTDRWQEAITLKSMVEQIWLNSEPAV